MQEINGNNYDYEVIRASYDQLVLVDFWAPWCGPCHQYLRTLELVQGKNLYPVLFSKLDVDQYTDAALDHKVMGVPHTKIIASGNVIDEFSDPLPPHELELFLKAGLLTTRILDYSHFRKLDLPIEKYIEELESEYHSSRRKDCYALVLAKYYLPTDPVLSSRFLEEIPDESHYFEDKLLLRDLFPLMKQEYSSLPVERKLWSARNALAKKNFESVYQFLLQAVRMNPAGTEDQTKLILMAFRQYLGEDHELSKKYRLQFDQVIA